MIRHVLLAPLLALAACAGLPRTTTPAERAEVGSMLATIETALGVLKSTDKIPADHYVQAMQQVADLRAAIAASEASPVTVAELLNRVAALAAVWAIYKG